VRRKRASGLTLYARYDREQVLEELGLPKRPAYLGGAFFTDGTVSASFATVGRSTQVCHFQRTGEFEWRMKPGGRVRRPPDTALGDISLLCKLEEDEKFTYLGRTSMHPAAWVREQTMVLSPALDPKQWKRWGIGRYQGWQVTFDG
jgi:hypothetical protein